MTAVSTCLVVVAILFADVNCDTSIHPSPFMKYVARRKRDDTQCSGDLTNLKGGCINSIKATSKSIRDEAYDGRHKVLKSAYLYLETVKQDVFKDATLRGRRDGLLNEHTRAIFLYAMSAELYADFNKAFKEGHDKYPVFHYWLQQAIDTLYKRKPAVGELYSGINQTLQAAVNSKLTLPGIASFSESKDIAQQYARQRGCTILKLKNSNNGVRIGELSAFPMIKEVLVPPTEEFEVVEIDRQSYFVTITLESTGQTFGCRACASVLRFSFKIAIVAVFCYLYL